VNSVHCGIAVIAGGLQILKANTTSAMTYTG
jgi:hypothetical protein